MKQLCACTWSSDVNKRAFPSTDILHTAFCTGVRNMSKDYLVFSSVEMPYTVLCAFSHTAEVFKLELHTLDEY